MDLTIKRFFSWDDELESNLDFRSLRDEKDLIIRDLMNGSLEMYKLNNIFIGLFIDKQMNELVMPIVQGRGFNKKIADFLFNIVKEKKLKGIRGHIQNPAVLKYFKRFAKINTIETVVIGVPL